MAERPEDLNLPNAVVGRIIKEAIPDGVNVSKEARLAISKAASVFVLYATSCSNNYALKAKRKTIGAQDVLQAMEEMEFEQFVEPLAEALEQFRNQIQDKKAATAGKKKDKDSTSTPSDYSSNPTGSNPQAVQEIDEEEEDDVTYQGEEKDGYVITVNEDDDMEDTEEQ